MYTAIRHSSSQVKTTGRLCSHIHSSSIQYQKLRSKQRGTSRTRLAQDLKPGSSSAQYEATQETSRFTRTGAPHLDPEFVKNQQTRSRTPSRPDDSKRASETKPIRSRLAPTPKPIAAIDDRQKSYHIPSRRDDSKHASEAKPLRSYLPPAPKSTATMDDCQKSYQAIISEIPESEFYNPPSPVSLSPLHDERNSTLSTTTPQLCTKFTSPPLLPGFLPAINSMLGPNSTPTPIQALSIKWLIEELGPELSADRWKQFLLASETGSGKSLAYLLPLMQKLKLDEESVAQNPDTRSSRRSLNPRAIILAPTHELARQLSSFAKVLARDVKLRAMCASRANTPSTTKSDSTAKKLAEQLDAITSGEIGELDVRKDKFPVDILVGTPVKIMEMIRGRGWDRLHGGIEPDEEGNWPKLRRGRDKMPGVGQWRKEPELGLENIEWVIVDEADVLFDPDFQEVTRTLLADISAARGQQVQVSPTDPSLSSFAPVTAPAVITEPINYPFNFILTSATIPKNLATYLDKHHPNLVRLTSPQLHHLPKKLQTQYASWTGGNKFADIEHRLREIWSSDAIAWRMVEPDSPPALSKILIFCNKSTKVMELAAYLEEKGVKCVALTGTSDQRKRGSNKHLEGFLRPVQINPDPARSSATPKKQVDEEIARDLKVTPHVMITTSLLSRGLDFAPELENVFIVDEPRNMVDFLHRAGRSGRAGRKGKVVIFTKMKGRGSERSKEVKERVRGLIRK